MKPYSTTISGLTSVFWWFQTGQHHSILKSKKRICCRASPIEHIDVLNISNINLQFGYNNFFLYKYVYIYIYQSTKIISKQKKQDDMFGGRFNGVKLNKQLKTPTPGYVGEDSMHIGFVSVAPQLS